MESKHDQCAQRSLRAISETSNRMRKDGEWCPSLTAQQVERFCHQLFTILTGRRRSDTPKQQSTYSFQSAAGSPDVRRMAANLAKLPGYCGRGQMLDPTAE
jgi:hypothetical protein